MKALRLLLAYIILLNICYAPMAGAEPLPYSLVDKNQYDIFEEEQQAQHEKELTLEEPPDDAQLLRYSNEFWRQAVTAVEGAYTLDKDPEPIPDLTLLNPTLSLPLYGTSIALTGRYVLGVNMKGKKYKSDPNSTVEDRNDHIVEMSQQLQLKMQGKILDRVFVDIDYDDQREEEKTISVAYRGKPGEFVQLAEFGDIDLALPQTEFISYEKQLFGAKMHLQHRNANLYLIGSQTKGSSKQKRFVGSSVSEIISLEDKNYIRRTYYDLTFGSNIRKYMDPDGNSHYKDAQETMAFNQAISTWSSFGSISPGTEEIYLDNNATSYTYVPVYKKASDLLETDTCLGASCLETKWELLNRGIDYTIDYVRGIITFKRSIKADASIAIDYRNTRGELLSSLGNSGTIKYIKLANDKLPTSLSEDKAIGNKLEMKTYYNIGAQKITPDNGAGNFILQLQDANGQQFSNPYFVYPTYVNIDFNTGIFDLDYRLEDVGLYDPTPVSSRNLKFKIQYQSTIKTYFVEAGMVVQSETVKLNGRPLSRNNDYYIDYTSGFITFYKGDQITENSVIDITYDTTGGESGNNSVLGGRLDYKLFDKITLGTTVIKEGGEKPNTVPQVGAYAKDLLVYGADINGKDIKLAEPLSVDFSVEAARSEKRQNLCGYAMIDSMNDASTQVGGSMVFKEWIFASNPNGRTTFFNTIHWDTQDLPSLQINPKAAANYNDKQQVLVLNYDFTQAQNYDPDLDEVSIVYPLSTVGIDLSDKTSFQLTMLGEEGGPQVNFAFGDIDEHSDNSTGMTTQCGTGVPKTEDVYCRNSLAPNEDIGWLFTNPDGTEERYNPFVYNVFNYETQPNGRIDTQDLNGNGRYDAENIPTGGNFGFAGTAIDGLTDNKATNTSWQTFSVPLEITNKSEWTAVHHLRITLKKGTNLKGQIKIANVGLSGTAWNPNSAPHVSDFSVSGINNVENANYEPIFNSRGDGQMVFNYLYGSLDNYREANKSVNAVDQSLRLKFNTVSADCDNEACYANRNFSTMDFTQHREFRFLLYNKDATQSQFFLKVGTDTNYDKIIVPLNDSSKGKWHLISVKMVDSNGDGMADTFQNVSDPGYGVKVESVRAPNGLLNFREVSLILAGVEKTNEAGSSGEVWLNVIHLADAIKLVGDAYKGDVVVRLDEWGSAGAKYVHKDSNFETPLSVSKQQKTTQEEYFVKMTRIAEFPMQANLTRSTVTTPMVSDSTNYNTVSMLDKGRVEKETAVVRGDFIKKGLPQIGLEYTQNSTEYDLMKRKDDSHTYGATLSHTAGAFKNMQAGYHYTTSSIDYAQERHLESDTFYNTDENTQKLNAKVTFQPNNSFNFTPSYSLSKSKEDRTQYKKQEDLHYPKAMNQNTGFNSTWKITKWLAPSVSYNIYTQENNNLSTKKSIVDRNQTFGIGQVKTINRNSDGGVTLTLSGNEILPQSKLFNTLVVSSSYRLQDADAWEDVDSGFDSRKELWIRSSFKDAGRFGYRRSMTLRDTFMSTQRWSPFAKYKVPGALAPWQTLTVINNFSKTIQNNEQTGTQYDSTSMTLPDLTVSISDLEKFFYSSSWLSSTNLKLRYSLVKQKNIGIDEQNNKQYGGDLRFMLFRFFDTVLNYTRHETDTWDVRGNYSLQRMVDDDMSAQTSFYVGAMRITPKVLYNAHDKWLARGRISESYTQWIPSLNLRWDFNLPRGWNLPFINRTYRTTNRVIWNTTFSYTDKKSPVEVKDNYRLFDATSSLDYEMSQNLRLTLSGGLSIMDHAYVESEDYTAYHVAANVTVQF
ncbi:MAG: hypothetical protein J6Q05_05360 [Elusimicrobiaceae bacterium]|nr:hypothetical protein [Elusimicrobiaceae bacterium]